MELTPDGRPVLRPSLVLAPQVSAAPAGATIGVEEEFHLVDPGTFALSGSEELIDAVGRGELGGRLQPEISTTQLESVTGVCQTLADLRAELTATRAAVGAAAAGAGLAVLAAATHPFSSWRDMPLTPAPRYAAMVERWGLIALQQDIVGCHVHVGVPDVDTAVAVMDRARPYLPVLIALTGSSPFHDGRDTGYESFRTLWWGRWPNTGAPEPLGDEAGFRAVVAQLVAAGAVADSSHLYWDVRPSSHVPTVEFRLADVCTRLDDTLLHAALVRSLVRVLVARAHDGEPVPEVRPEVLRAARWRAARQGLDGQLLDPAAGVLVDARAAVEAFVGELAEDLRAAGEWEEVRELLDALLARGTSAARQRAVWRRTGDLREVAAAVVREGGFGR